MLIIDGHLDLAWNALQWNRDLLHSVYTIRNAERRETIPVPGLGMGTVAFPEMRQGRVALSFATLMARSTGHAVPYVDYSSPAQAYGVARGQVAYYRALERLGYARIIVDTIDLGKHTADWKQWESGDNAGQSKTPPLGFVISMEGADPILAPDQLQEWWESGLRILGMVHYGPGRYAGGTDTELGLTDIGRQLVSGMSQLNIILDLTHLSDQSFWQALECYDGPVLASHSNCRALVPNQRQLSDQQLEAVFQRDGVVGVSLVALMLQPGWIIGRSSNKDLRLEQVVDHIDHICQLAGRCHHAAIGSDLDGGCGRETVPKDLENVADLQKLPELLADRGYRDEDIAMIMHDNWLRLLRRAWSDQ